MSQSDTESGLQKSSLSDRQKAAAEIEAREQADTLATKQPSEYIHMGRGGAGNFTPSVEVAPPASAPEVAPPPISVPRVDPFLAARSGYYGRGGAGNYNQTSEEVTRARKAAEEAAETRRQEEVRRQVEESVHAEMKRPEGAVTREGREREWSRIF